MLMDDNVKFGNVNCKSNTFVVVKYKSCMNKLCVCK